MYPCVCVCVRVRVCIYMYICVYIYIYTRLHETVYVYLSTNKIWLYGTFGLFTHLHTHRCVQNAFTIIRIIISTELQYLHLHLHTHGTKRCMRDPLRGRKVFSCPVHWAINCLLRNVHRVLTKELSHYFLYSIVCSDSLRWCWEFSLMFLVEKIVCCTAERTMFVVTIIL